jgi:hypothetical protein
VWNFDGNLLGFLRKYRIVAQILKEKGSGDAGAHQDQYEIYA